MKGSQYLRKAMTVLVILSMFLGLSGCLNKAETTVSDLSMLSTACGHMARTYSYSFLMKKDEGKWFFSASCFADREEFQVEIENQPITTEETEDFLRIVDEENLIRSIRQYRKPFLSRFFHVSDQTMYSTLIRFEDGTEYDAETDVGKEMTDFFYRLANRYDEAAEEEETVDIRELSIFAGHMAYSYSYAFDLTKDADGWFFSFDCAIDRMGEHVKVENCPVTEEEAQALIDIAKEQNLLRRIKRYRKPGEDESFALDETSYKTTIGFADESSVYAPIDPKTELTEAFYRLAEKYKNYK